MPRTVSRGPMRSAESYLRQNVKPSSTQIGYVYLIGASGLPTKIGFTTDIKKRLKGLQNQSPVYVHLILLGYGDGANIVEHELCSHFAHLHNHAEWFDLDAESIFEAKEIMCKRKLLVSA